MFFEMAGVAELICLEDAIVMGVNPLRERITMEVKNSVQVRILLPATPCDRDVAKKTPRLSTTEHRGFAT